MPLVYLLIFSIFVLPLQAQDKYILGEGYQPGAFPLYIGGYFSLDYKQIDEEKRFSVDDISFLSYGGNNTLSYLAELEFKELYVQTYNGDVKTTQRDHNLYIERLYIDYTLNDNYSLRAGKFNSAIGFWNLMPINVLRATTSSPEVTEVIFPKFTSGLDLSYSSFDENEIRVDLILQNNAPIDDEYNNYNIDQHYALGFSYEKDDYTLKLNGGYFSKRENHPHIDSFAYALISAKLEKENYQLLAEMGRQESKDSHSNYATYVQGLYRFTAQHIGIIRLESYKDELENRDDTMAIFGYTYRPLYPVALKTEYQQHRNNSENQLIFSFSVLF